MELTEAWLQEIVENHTAADQDLIDSAIKQATLKLEESNKLPSMYVRQKNLATRPL